MPDRVRLRETEIRPDHLMKEQAERFGADVRQLLTRRGEFAEVACPACDARMAREAFVKYGMRYVSCGDCETLYISPRPTPEILASYYSKSQNYSYWNAVIFPASEAVRREKIFRPRMTRVLEICRRYSVPMDTLVEVGAGFGTFLEEVRAADVFRRLVAVEPTPELAATCRARGLDVIEKPIEEVRFEAGTVNVVTSFEVIEHLFEPRRYLRACGEILAPGGLLIVTCPNVKGFDIIVLREMATSIDAEHLNYFHPASLGRLLRSCGFEVLESQTPGRLDAELVRKRVLAGEFDLAGQPFLRQVLLDRWEEVGENFQHFLAGNGLSSHMWLVARKPS